MSTRPARASANDSPFCESRSLMGDLEDDLTCYRAPLLMGAAAA